MRAQRAWLIGNGYGALFALEISHQSALDSQRIRIGTFDDVDVARQHHSRKIAFETQLGIRNRSHSCWKLEVNSISRDRQFRRAWLGAEKIQVAFAFDRTTIQRTFQPCHLDLVAIEVETHLKILGRDPRLLDLGLTVLHFDKTIQLGLTHRPSHGNTEPRVTGGLYTVVKQGKHRSVRVAFEFDVDELRNLEGPQCR